MVSIDGRYNYGILPICECAEERITDLSLFLYAFWQGQLYVI